MMSSLVLHIAAQTDTGLVRAHNEDAIALDVTHGTIALADGMGGYNAGEVASRMAADGVVNDLRDAMQGMSEADDQAKSSDLRHLLVGAITKANDNIRAAALAEAHLHGMGTTLVAGLFCDSRLVLAHLGDSRCYRLRDGAFVQLTRDHSQVQEQVDAGLLPADWARHAPHKNLITRALGVADDIEVDIVEHALVTGDLYLFCSDGLSDMLADETLAAMLQSDDGDLELLTAALIQAANLEGGRDNISVALVRIASCPTSSVTGFLNKLKSWMGS